MSDCSVGDV